MEGIFRGLSSDCRRGVLSIAIAGALGVVSVAPASSATVPLGAIVVTNCDDSGPGSLRDAVQGNVSGLPIDLSQLSCSTITLTSGAIEATQSMMLVGPGSAALAIDGNHRSAVFVEGDASVTLSIQRVTVKNGYVAGGNGGCIFSAGSVTLDDVVVTACEVAAHGVAKGQLFIGGGIAVNGDFSATDSRIEGNTLNVSTARACGGGLFSGGNTTLVNTSISGNAVSVIAAMSGRYQDAAEGGGAYVLGTVSMTRSTISNNTVYSVEGSKGGGIWAYGYMVMDYSMLSGNAAVPTVLVGSEGGGAFILSSIAVNHSTISGNTATDAGGIFAIYYGDYTRLNDSTVSGNMAFSASGAIFGYALYSYNSTIAFNVGNGSGAVNMTKVIADLTSTIVFDNSTLTGEPNDIGGMRYIVGSHNVIGHANVFTVPDDTIRLDPMLAPLADNGGPTLTHALLPGSPAIDTGIAAAAVNWDQRGEGYPRTIGGGADIGAYEAPLPDHVPVASNDAYTTSEDTELIVDAPGVLANDTDADGDALSAVLVDDVSNGILTLQADGGVVYVPIQGFFGTDTFTYQVTDGVTSSNVATVTIQVQKVVNNDLVFHNGFD